MTTDAIASVVQPATPKIKSELLQQRVRAARWFLVPMLIALAVVAGWPLLRSIWFSFTDVTLNDLYGAEWASAITCAGRC
jgi:trehalose/maltose transport system permease protein